MTESTVRGFRVAEWQCDKIVSDIKKKLLDPSPPFQRRAVWNTRDKVALINSIILRFPIGAITVLESPDGKGNLRYSVIDGKQRISAISEFASAKHIGLEYADVQSLSEFLPPDKLISGKALSAKPDGPFFWNELSPAFRRRFESFPIGVLVITGSVREAQQAFSRMNKTVYRLEPQEIRNATYQGFPVLDAAARLSADWKDCPPNPLTVWGVLSVQGRK